MIVIKLVVQENPKDRILVHCFGRGRGKTTRSEKRVALEIVTEMSQVVEDRHKLLKEGQSALSIEYPENVQKMFGKRIRRAQS